MTKWKTIIYISPQCSRLKMIVQTYVMTADVAFKSLTKKCNNIYTTHTLNKENNVWTCNNIFTCVLFNLWVCKQSYVLKNNIIFSFQYMYMASIGFN